jgi:hypothetical protein
MHAPSQKSQTSALSRVYCPNIFLWILENFDSLPEIGDVKSEVTGQLV